MHIRCEGEPIRIKYEEKKIFTVFPMNYPKKYESIYLPQEFDTYEEALEYAESLDCDYEISEA